MFDKIVFVLLKEKDDNLSSYFLKITHLKNLKG